MTKSFTVNYNGKDEAIEFEDKPRAATVIKVLKNCTKYKAGNPIPDLDLDEYLLGLATNLVTKAPWTLQNPDAVKNLPWETYAKLCEALGDAFPLENFLYSAAKLMYGKKLENLADSPPSTSSTTSSASSESLSVE